MGRNKKKRRKLQRARCIRSYRRIAYIHHGVCEVCQQHIHPGEEYEGSVWVNGARLWVKKEHAFCVPWDWDHYHEEFEDEEMEDLNEERYDKAA